MYETEGDNELDKMQASVLAWYRNFMKDRISLLETVLASRNRV